MVESILVLFIQTGAEIGVGAGKETKKTELVKYRPALHQFMCRPLLPPPPFLLPHTSTVLREPEFRFLPT